MKEIALSRGLVAKVDDEDYEFLSQWKWSALKTGGPIRGERVTRFYACRTENKKTILMHRQLMGVSDRSQKVDHKDRDTLNNQRGNLRHCTGKQNDANRIGWSGEVTSTFRGVSWDKGTRKWRAGYRGKYLGIFKDQKSAANRVDEEMKKKAAEELPFLRFNLNDGGDHLKSI